MLHIELPRWNIKCDRHQATTVTIYSQHVFNEILVSLEILRHVLIVTYEYVTILQAIAACAA